MAERARGGEHDRTAVGLDRRQVLRRTAVVGGAIWAAPALLTVSRASAAELHSAPPSGGTNPDEVGGSVERPGAGGGTTPTDPQTTGPQATGGQPTAQPTPAVPTQVGGFSQAALPAAPPQPVAARGGTLPRTGADVDRLVGTGLAAVAGGSLLRWWSVDRIVDAPVKGEPPAPTV